MCSRRNSWFLNRPRARVAQNRRKSVARRIESMVQRCDRWVESMAQFMSAAAIRGKFRNGAVAEWGLKW